VRGGSTTTRGPPQAFSIFGYISSFTLTAGPTTTLSCLLLSSQAMRRPCQLSHRTEPLVIRNQPNASVELLVISISKPGVAALTCMDSPNVHIKNVRIEHAHGGVGIRFERCPSLRLEDVSVVAVAAPSRPTRCLLRNQDCDNIHGSNSADVVLHRVRVSGGATGVELHLCPRARVTYFVAMNVLGPYPRGQCIQFASSHGATLDHFYCRNEPSASWTEDSVSVWRSGGAVVSNGLVDGNNSPTGVGVMFENDAAAALGGAIENVDAINMGNGCFSGYPARDLVMTRTRCGWNHCGGGGAPLGGGGGGGRLPHRTGRCGPRGMHTPTTATSRRRWHTHAARTVGSHLRGSS
jgi:hypothetical protein